jgi:hypothetical protein
LGGESGGGGSGGGGVEQDGGAVAALFAIAKSGFPSPLMSPMLTRGASASREVTWVAKVGVVAPGGGGVEQDGGGVADEFATAKSGFPSPLMSPMLTEKGDRQ